MSYDLDACLTYTLRIALCHSYINKKWLLTNISDHFQNAVVMTVCSDTDTLINKLDFQGSNVTSKHFYDSEDYVIINLFVAVSKETG